MNKLIKNHPRKLASLSVGILLMSMAVGFQWSRETTEGSCANHEISELLQEVDGEYTTVSMNPDQEPEEAIFGQDSLEDEEVQRSVPLSVESTLLDLQESHVASNLGTVLLGGLAMETDGSHLALWEVPQPTW